MRRFGHIMAHIGLGTLQVANAAHAFIPFPGNVIAAGALAGVQGVVALKHHKPVVTAVVDAVKDDDQ